jgi:hypothetical protein
MKLCRKSADSDTNSLFQRETAEENVTTLDRRIRVGRGRHRTSLGRRCKLERLAFGREQGAKAVNNRRIGRCSMIHLSGVLKVGKRSQHGSTTTLVRIWHVHYGSSYAEIFTAVFVFARHMHVRVEEVGSAGAWEGSGVRDPSTT